MAHLWLNQDLNKLSVTDTADLLKQPAPCRNSWAVSSRMCSLLSIDLVQGQGAPWDTLQHHFSGQDKKCTDLPHSPNPMPMRVGTLTVNQIPMISHLCRLWEAGRAEWLLGWQWLTWHGRLGCQGADTPLSSLSSYWKTDPHWKTNKQTVQTNRVKEQTRYKVQI